MTRGHPRHREQRRIGAVPLRWLLGILLVAGVLAGASPSATGAPAAAPAGGAAAVAVDGATRYQAIDGFGVNAIPKTWQGGALKPGIDLLLSQGSTLWRVDVNNGHSDWEGTN